MADPAAPAGAVRYPKAASGDKPLAVLATAAAAGVVLTPTPVEDSDEICLVLAADGSKIFGEATIMRYIAREWGAAVANPSDAPAEGAAIALYGDGSAAQAAEIDQWLEFAASVSGATYMDAAKAASEALALRTFAVGHALSIADIALWAAFTAAPRWGSVARQPALAHLARWAAYVSLCPPMAATRAAHGRPVFVKGDRKEAAGKGGKGGKQIQGKGGEGPADIELPNAVHGKVCTRFPPEPSGYLHIGHVKAALLNAHFARKYGGKLICRFDDTNPSKEKDEFVVNITNDLKTLGIIPDEITYTSDHFPKIMKKIEEHLKSGLFYIDDTPAEQMSKERMDGIESKWRKEAKPAECLELWKEMLAGTERGQQCCVRARIDMQEKNKCLRDPVMARCNLTPHHRTGTKYKVYPTYDCACPFVDAIEGVTHALRSSEYHDRNALYNWMLKAHGVSHVEIWDFSRLNMMYTLMSKRKLQWFVDNKKVEGWFDPRFPTVQGMVRRGLKVEALQEFILLQGASKNSNLMEWDKLWTINKRMIDPVCPRHACVLVDTKVKVTMAGAPQAEVKTVPKHKKFEGAGFKATLMSPNLIIDMEDALAMTEGQEVTFMDWGNAYVRKIDKDADGTITHIACELHLEGSVKSTKLKLHWLSTDSEVVDVELVDFDYLITKPKLDPDDDFKDVLNKDTMKVTLAHGDQNMRQLQKGEHLQIERKGYYMVDKACMPGHPLRLLSVPDGGKSKTQKR